MNIGSSVLATDNWNTSSLNPKHYSREIFKINTLTLASEIC